MSVSAKEDLESSYNLRSDSCPLRFITKKREDELRNSARKCPTLPSKRTPTQIPSGAWPLGALGHLSPLYDPTSGVAYLDQLYVEVDKIGEGSFGTVYRYKSLEDGKTYAIKMIKKYGTKDRYSEIRALDKVASNDYCIQYRNAWIEKQLIYIQFDMAIMSLGDYSHKNHNICEAECWNILTDILRALAQIHKDGWVHMDIKPDNIMICYDGLYKLCDFGLLTKAGNKEVNKLTVSEGDAKYLAKEVLVGNISAAGDIFSLGISLLELQLDLVLPVYGPCWHELRESKCILSPSFASKRISIDMISVINWMMEINPKNRPSADQLLKSPALKSRIRTKKQRCNYFADILGAVEAEQRASPWRDNVGRGPERGEDVHNCSGAEDSDEESVRSVAAGRGRSLFNAVPQQQQQLSAGENDLAELGVVRIVQDGTPEKKRQYPPSPSPPTPKKFKGWGRSSAAANARAGPFKQWMIQASQLENSDE